MYTRRGDRGETSLYGSKRVAKDSPRVEAYGSIDELNSVLGVAISLSKNARTSASLRAIQKMLFVAGADSAAEYGGSRKVPRISASDTLRLEKMTDDLLGRLPTLKNFILPGGSPIGAHLQLSRAVCRRTERRLLTASRAEKMNPELLPFFNRLSSYLFNLSRWTNKEAGRSEDVWKG
jgi:cob(I)alamin adenosyltransferase